MMRRFANLLLAWALAVPTLAVLSPIARAANCSAGDITSMTVSFSPATPTYTTATGAITAATLLASTSNGANCTNLAVGFTASAGTLTGPSGNTLAFSIAGAPLTSAPLPLGNVNGVSQVLGASTYTTTFAAGQLKPAGLYSMGAPPSVEAVLFTQSGQIFSEIRRATFSLQTNITGSCSLSSGTAATASVSFTGHISNGVPAATVKQHSLNVDCTVLAKVRLSGSAMTTANPATGAFDNFINYRAIATFAGATTTLVTNGTAPVTSTSSSLSSTIGDNLPVTIDINMIAGSKPLLAGSYSNVMTVTVDPNL